MEKCSSIVFNMVPTSLSWYRVLLTLVCLSALPIFGAIDLIILSSTQLVLVRISSKYIPCAYACHPINLLSSLLLLWSVVVIVKYFIYWTADLKSSRLWSSQLWTQFKPEKVRTSTGFGHSLLDLLFLLLFRKQRLRRKEKEKAFAKISKHCWKDAFVSG